ncbi:MAG: murein L,D-transpeptidase [Gammaproteobacteria bacterium]|nr:MAG: murein L,D-transpeptidase [Gammaproteobacteria bacterium]
MVEPLPVEGNRKIAPWIRVSVASQRLTLIGADGQTIFKSSISTAARGVGEQINSLQTPRGWHQIRACIGAGVPENGVFVGRRFNGEVYTPERDQAAPNRDWILTRILWLSGLESGVNRLGQCDTMRRYIYIHGTPTRNVMGQLGSHGCIRMHNKPLMELFAQVITGTRVWITEE